MQNKSIDVTKWKADMSSQYDQFDMRYLTRQLKLVRSPHSEITL